MIQTIQLHILFEWDQNYFFQSNILFTQYILTPVHPLNTSYIIIYLNTLGVGLCPHTHFTHSIAISHLSKILCCNMIQTIQLQILFQWDQNYFLQSNKLFTQYILTPVHPLNTSYDNNLFKHTLGEVYVHISILLLHGHFHLSKMLCHNMIQTIQLHILFQWDQNYFLQSNILFTQYILKQVHPLNTTYDNNLFKHTLGGFMSTYPFYSSMAISTCPKCYIATWWFKLFNYTYYFNGIKIISFSQIYFSLNIF